MRDAGTIEIGTDATPRAATDLEGLIESPGDGDDRRFVTLYVRDHGVGMDGDVRARLFEPFFSTKEFGQTSGLGLPSVYGIVRQHRGLLGVTTAPGNGSTFFVYLPVSADPAFKGPSAGSGPSLTRPGQKPDILLVEDDPAILTILEKSLTQAGYPVHTASSAEQALELMEHHAIPFHLLVTDIVMPGMNGKELADTLRNHVPGLPVLFITGYIPEKVEACGIDPARDPILYKPFMPKQLLDKVGELTGPRA
jgi:CheY-like chemotaxis protein